jgi:tRNA-uridine 2-sulfurtransferase
MFPIGDTRKADVRAEAARRGLAVADKPDSHDICFIADGDTQAFLQSRLGAQPGPVVDAVSGDVVGEHAGAYAFTVGQRRGLRVGVPAADGRPRYVLDVSPVTRTVTVGPAELLDVDVVAAAVPTWCGQAPDLPFEGSAQLRAHGAPVGCTADVVAGRLVVRLHEPVRGVAPGQTVVVYDDDRVVGSATIERASAVG